MKKNHTDLCQSCEETQSRTSLFTHINWYGKFLERTLGIHIKNRKHAHALFQYKSSGNLSQGNNQRKDRPKFIIHPSEYLNSEAVKYPRHQGMAD